MANSPLGERCYNHAAASVLADDYQGEQAMLQRLKAYAELLRVSNVLTAISNVWMGMIVATGGLPAPKISVPLTLASVFLYLGGMVLNDVFDVERDAMDRPTRPIPSGRVARRHATVLAWALLLLGLMAASLASLGVGSPESLLLAVCLAVWIVFYNRQKETPVGPVIMGMCRATNVALGLSGGGALSKNGLIAPGYLAAGVFLYIVGLTWFARHEERVSRPGQLILAAVVSLFGLAVLAAFPVILLPKETLVIPHNRWVLLWVVVSLLVARRYVAAILQPTPRHVQSAVGNAIQSIILIDAALAWGYAGQFWGLAILALWPLTMLLARFIPQT